MLVGFMGMVRRKNEEIKRGFLEGEEKRKRSSGMKMRKGKGVEK